jgi:threonine synthase
LLEGSTLIFKCTRCGEVYSEPRVLCPICKGLVRVEFNVIKEKYYETGIWRYYRHLPSFTDIITLGEGNTPLVESTRISRELRVYFKDEGRNPTGSVRDRAASVIISHATSSKAKRVVVVSDGNMGVSVSAYATRAGLKTTVYAPSWIDWEKALLVKAYGGRLIVEDKSIDVLVREVEKKSRESGIYNATSTWNTLSIEGLKTIAYEVVEELGKAPRAIYVPLGSGLTYLALYIGFKELYESGVISKIPIIIGVEHCGNPKYAEYFGISSKCREEVYPGLRYTTPLIYNFVIEAISESGFVIVVTSKETIRAAKTLASREGLFTEISSAVSLAGFLRNPLDESVIVLFGHGLKSASSYTRPSRRRFTEPFVGVTKRLILEVLKTRPGLTGYEVWRLLGLNITPQAVYQHLRELVEAGYLRVSIENGVKKYYITR